MLKDELDEFVLLVRGSSGVQTLANIIPFGFVLFDLDQDNEWAVKWPPDPGIKIKIHVKMITNIQY